MTLKELAKEMSTGLEKKKADITEETNSGLHQVFDETEKSALFESVEKAAELTFDTNTEDYDRAVAYLKMQGRTDEEIDAVPYRQLCIIGSKEVGDGNIMEKELKERENKETIPESTVVEKEIEVVVETKTPQNFTPSVIEEEDDEVSDRVKDLTGNKLVKYSDKPLNAYRRGIEGKRAKLLNREKRGKYCSIPLPNSNLRLNIYELRQPNVRNGVSNELMLSHEIYNRYKALKDILDRSEVVCADGATITTDQQLKNISHDDIPYIYLGAGVANSIDRIPMAVACNVCGTPGDISIDLEDRVMVAINNIPQEIILDHNPKDTFGECILRSRTGVEAIVEDKEACVKIYLSNPSIEKNIIMGDATRKKVVEKFQDYIPEKHAYAPLDMKYNLILQHAQTDTEIVHLISGMILLSFVDKIEYYNMDIIDNWDSKENLDFTVGGEDSIETMIDALVQLEKTTIDLIDAIIDEKFIRHSIKVETDDWVCHKCNQKNRSVIQGLLALTTTLQMRIMRGE